jgi:hypothetical protein
MNIPTLGEYGELILIALLAWLLMSIFLYAFSWGRLWWRLYRARRALQQLQVAIDELRADIAAAAERNKK